ncbi:MAG: hypothetical protein IPO09_15020 [Anaeromyxobacter sp.]|nr:hypothetical protein [Anaeromyxobacter sp.]MBL0277094.1 hypothetical protein [Anaeromyxobacter sp.]
MPTTRAKPTTPKKPAGRAPPKKAGKTSARPAPLPSIPPPANAPLTVKLGVTPGTTIVVLGAPAGYRQKLGPLPEGARLVNVVPAEAAFVHLFARDGAALSSRLREVSPRLTDDATVWVSFPKADSGAGSDLSRDKIRALTGPFGLEPAGSVVLDNIWAGLRFIRIAEE